MTGARRMTRAFVLMIAAASAASCGAPGGGGARSGSLTITHAVMTSPASDSEAAAFLMVRNRSGTPAALTSVRSPDARSIQLYGGGWPVSTIDVPARGRVRMMPNGYHMVLSGLTRRLASGDTITLELRFDSGDAVGLRAPVLPYISTAGIPGAGRAGNELLWWCAVLAAAGDDQMEAAYFWVGVLLAGLPVAIFGTIGFFVTRAYFRQRRANPIPAAGPLPEV